MSPETCLLLYYDATLQQLCVTWPNVKPHHVGPDPQTLRLNLAEWARISGIDQVVIQEKAAILFGNDLCREDGTSDQDALQYCAVIAASVLESLAKGKRPPKH